MLCRDYTVVKAFLKLRFLPNYLVMASYEFDIM